MADCLLLSVGHPSIGDTTMNLFVDGLPPSFNNADVADLFSQFGTVLSADVARNKNGESLQFGFVAMATSREAYHAMERLNGSAVCEHLLLVLIAENQWAECRSKHSPQDRPPYGSRK